MVINPGFAFFEQPGAGYYVIGLLLYSIRYRIGLQKTGTSNHTPKTVNIVVMVPL